MNISEISGVEIKSIYACVPEIEVDNIAALSELCDEKEAENIVKTIGFEKRFIAKSGTSSLDLCCECAKRMMADLEIDKDEIGGIVFVTFTPENIMPANATGIQARLGLNNNIPAFDLGLACSGYGYGLWVSALMAKNLNKQILLLDGDIQTAYISGKDKGTLPVMADAGSATLVSPTDSGDTWKFAFYTDGTRRDSLMIKAGGSGHPTTEEDIRLHKWEDGEERKNTDIYMDGFGIYKFVAQDVSKFLKEFMEEAGLEADAIDGFVPHQANMYMIKQLTRKIKIDKDKLWMSGHKVGNSSSATVPVTMAMNAGELLKEGKSNILFAGFGGGLSISCGNITLSSDAAYKLFRYGNAQYPKSYQQTTLSTEDNNGQISGIRSFNI